MKINVHTRACRQIPRAALLVLVFPELELQEHAPAGGAWARRAPTPRGRPGGEWGGRALRGKKPAPCAAPCGDARPCGLQGQRARSQAADLWLPEAGNPLQDGGVVGPDCGDGCPTINAFAVGVFYGVSYTPVSLFKKVTVPSPRRTWRYTMVPRTAGWTQLVAASGMFWPLLHWPAEQGTSSRGRPRPRP